MDCAMCAYRPMRCDAANPAEVSRHGGRHEERALQRTTASVRLRTCTWFRCFFTVFSVSSSCRAIAVLDGGVAFGDQETWLSRECRL
jgi:hypothetical protein